MLKLKNIKIKNNIAQADFSPENTNIWGHVEVNLQSREITSCNNVRDMEALTVHTQNGNS